MAEMPDVVGGETITNEWGNLIRSRTVQRYATVAARTAAHPSPTEGDLAYMQDANTVLVYDGTVWVPLDVGSEVDGLTEVGGPVSVTGSYTTMATVTLTIPTVWLSWKCHASATSGVNCSTAGTVGYLIGVDGTDSQAQEIALGAGAWESLSVQGRRSPMTTTGARTVTLRARALSGVFALNSVSVYARAVRLT